jgi:hypothetical protein
LPLLQKQQTKKARPLQAGLLLDIGGKLEPLTPNFSHYKIEDDCSINRLSRNVDPRRSKRALSLVIHIKLDGVWVHIQTLTLFAFEFDIGVDHVVIKHAAFF